MAWSGCSALVRRLAPTSKLGHIVSKLLGCSSSLSQHPHLQSPVGYSLGSSETTSRRLFRSRSALQLPVEFSDKRSGSRSARSYRKYHAESSNAGKQEARRRAPLGYYSRQTSASRTPRNLRIDSVGEAGDNAVEHEPFKVKPKSTSAEKPRVQQRNEERPKAFHGELARQADKPSVYVSSDFVDHRAMQLVFLGTSSSIPTSNRSTSCIALRLEGSIFLFDCGEGAVRQILKTPMKHYDIGNIFITHMHGDHIYGLPDTSWLCSGKFTLSTLCTLHRIACEVGRIVRRGNLSTDEMTSGGLDFYPTIITRLLCRIGLKEFQSKNPIHVYGPQGLRQWIRSTLKASHARVHPKYTVHEMIVKKKHSNTIDSWNLVEENHDDELPGEDIGRSSDGLWHIYTDDKYRVRASFLKHTIPCWGYVVEEHTRRGRFNVERALEAGVKPGRYFRLLETGNSVTLANGKVVFPADVLGPCRRGRKVVILGDTCDSNSMAAAAIEADVIVHEATVLEQDASEAYRRGHSTAKMAGEFARIVDAGTLVLTHFSRKLDGALFVDEKSQVRTTIKDLVSAAQQAFGKDSVIAAEDMMAITVQLADKLPIQLANK